MGIIEAIKKGFSETSRLMNVVAVFFVFNVVVGLISLPLANPARVGDPGILTISFIVSIVFFLAFVFLQGGAMGLVKEQIKTGITSIANIFEYGKKFWTRILWLLIFYIIITTVVVALLIMASTGIMLIGDNIITRALVAFVIAVVGLTIITFLIYPVYTIVIEDEVVQAGVFSGCASAFNALKRGISVALANFWITMALFLLMLIISLVISLIVGLIVGVITIPLPLALSQIVITIFNSAVQSYIPIVMMVAFMSFYMALTSGLASSAPAAPEEETPQGGEGM
ncbi:MAG: hypothetical protein HQ594_01175 [Candidatus Omnitrophica bacterium]|nr:hypothetical protein [Candidatus Omnitrophota bacterium]